MMSAPQPRRLLLVTGLPGAGKTTLARYLARRLAWPLLNKDTIKEALMDCLPPGLVGTDGGEREHSRLLSNASFAVLFALARELLAHGSGLILEGNFRRGEHEAPLTGIPQLAVAQVLCQVPEEVRRARLLARQHDPARHPGHRDAQLVPSTGGADYLALPGERWEFTGAGEPDAAWLARLAQWLRS